MPRRSMCSTHLSSSSLASGAFSLEGDPSHVHHTQYRSSTSTVPCRRLATVSRSLLASNQHKVVLVDRNAGWRSLPVDPFGKQAAFLKRFGMAGWETLTRGEASAILDCEFAALDTERKPRLVGTSEQAAFRNKSGRGVS